MKDEFERLRDLATLSDEFKAIIQSRMYDLINTHIFEKLNQRAFETFKKVKAEDTTAVIETQMMSKMIEAIKREFEIVISEGDAARTHLMNTEEGGY